MNLLKRLMGQDRPVSEADRERAIRLIDRFKPGNTPSPHDFLEVVQLVKFRPLTLEERYGWSGAPEDAEIAYLLDPRDEANGLCLVKGEDQVNVTGPGDVVRIFRIELW